MRYESLYIIRPAETLKRQLKQADPDIALLLERSYLWTKSEGGRTVWTEQDYAAQVKLLFLLKLWADYVIDAGEDKSLREYLEDLLGGPPFSEELFDQWWMLERFDGVDESFEAVEERLGLEQPYLLANSPLPRVEAWLSGLEKQ